MAMVTIMWLKFQWKARYPPSLQFPSGTSNSTQPTDKSTHWYGNELGWLKGDHTKGNHRATRSPGMRHQLQPSYKATRPPPPSVLMLINDPQNIDKDIPEFKEGLVSSAENIVVWMWNAMQQHLPSPSRLHKIKLYETENNSVTYRGE